MSLEKEFVPYELAVKLKELGFDEPCFGGWDNNNKWWYHPDSDIETDAPLWQQAFDWFEEKHNLHSHIDNIVLSFGVIDCRNNDIKINKYISSEDCYKTRLEVKQSCLEKLIEIVSCSSEN